MKGTERKKTGKKKKGRREDRKRVRERSKRGRFANFLGEEKLDYEI